MKLDTAWCSDEIEPSGAAWIHINKGWEPPGWLLQRGRRQRACTPLARPVVAPGEKRAAIAGNNARAEKSLHGGKDQTFAQLGKFYR